MFATQFTQELNGSCILHVDASVETVTRQWLLSTGVEIDLEYPSVFPRNTYCFSFHSLPSTVVDCIERHLGYDLDEQYEAACDDRMARYGY